MWEFFCLLFALLFTAYFLNYKITKCVTAWAFQQQETPFEANVGFVSMILATIFWSIYITFC